MPRSALLAWTYPSLNGSQLKPCKHGIQYARRQILALRQSPYPSSSRRRWNVRIQPRRSSLKPSSQRLKFERITDGCLGNWRLAWKLASYHSGDHDWATETDLQQKVGDELCGSAWAPSERLHFIASRDIEPLCEQRLDLHKCAVTKSEINQFCPKGIQLDRR